MNNKYHLLNLWLFAAIGFYSSAQVTAQTTAGETYYVSDIVYAPLRSGKGLQFRIIHAGLRSGTPLEILDKESDNEWTQVRTHDGKTGWMRSQYLISSPTGRIQLVEAQKQIAQLTEKNHELKKTSQTVEQSNTQLNRELRRTLTQRDDLTKELQKIKSISANALNLNRQHQELVAKHQVLQTQRDSLKAENEQLKSSESLTFFLYGVAAVLLGVIITVVAPRLKPKKRYSDWA